MLLTESEMFQLIPYGQSVVTHFISAAMDGGATGVVNMDVYTSERNGVITTDAR